MPSNAPQYQVMRKDVAAVDASIPTDRNAGKSFAGYDQALFQVIPSGGANPSIELMEWSEEAGTFISANTKLEKTGLGVDVPYAFSAYALGRRFWVRVTLLGAGSVTITAAGHRTGSW